MKEFFKVNASKYKKDKNFFVVRPASLGNPKSNSIMFIIEKYLKDADVFNSVENCIIFWPCSAEVPAAIEQKHCVIKSSEPHTDYCRFFSENGITYLPPKEKFVLTDGAYIALDAKLGKNCTVMPGAYIGGDCVIGDGVYIGAGARLVGNVVCGNNVVIRENTVIGADGLSTDRDVDFTALTMPQFGGVVIGDNVQIGANTVIARGAIDDTVIKSGAKIDSHCFISHNTLIGENTFIVGETILFGSASVGRNTLISGNCTVANGVHIGDNSVIGMHSTVLKSLPDNVVAFGNPIKNMKER